MKYRRTSLVMLCDTSLKEFLHLLYATDPQIHGKRQSIFIEKERGIGMINRRLCTSDIDGPDYSKENQLLLH